MNASPRPPRRTTAFVAGGAILILAVTCLFGEALFRVVGIHPLTREAIVWRYHPRWGWAHAPNAAGWFVKLRVRQWIRINSRGLREREIPYERDPSRKRILVLGDSEVVGFEVPPEKTFTRAAENVLNAAGYSVEIINAGCRGYGTDQELLFLQDEGMKYKPDVVIDNWNGTDFDDNRTLHRPFRKFGKPAFSPTPDGGLRLQGVPVPDYPYEEDVVLDESGAVRRSGVGGWQWFKFAIVRDALICHSAFATGLVLIATSVSSRIGALMGKSGAYYASAAPNARGSPLYDLTVALIAAMAKTAAAGGARFYMIASEPTRVSQLANDAKATALDVDKTFGPATAALPVQRYRVAYDGHFNELGHALYGKAVAEAMMRAGVLPSRNGGGGGAPPAVPARAAR